MKKYWIIFLAAVVLLILITAVFLISFLAIPESANSNLSVLSNVSSITEEVVKTATIKIQQVSSNQQIIPIQNSNQSTDTDAVGESDKTISLVFMGDMMFDRTVADRTRRAGNQKYPFLIIAGSSTNIITSADIAVANLEGPVASDRAAPDKGDLDFMFEPAIAPLLKEAGIDAVSQANNHALDQGRAGAVESRNLLSQAGLAVFGDQVNDDAAAALTIIDVRGQKVALLGFNVTDNPLDKASAEAALESAYAEARYVIVFMHWGEEYQSSPTMSQVELAHWFIDKGVDAVVGSHPHWMQSIEVYNNRPIIYSLGNFIFDQDWSSETNFGLIAGLALNPETTELSLYPIQIKASQPSLLEGADRQTRLDRLANISNPSLADRIKSGKLILIQ